MHQTETGEGAMLYLFIARGFFWQIWGLLPSGAFDLQHLQEVPGGQCQPVPNTS